MNFLLKYYYLRVCVRFHKNYELIKHYEHNFHFLLNEFYKYEQKFKNEFILIHIFIHTGDIYRCTMHFKST